jgi:hypothetical protein
VRAVNVHSDMAKAVAVCELNSFRAKAVADVAARINEMIDEAIRMEAQIKPTAEKIMKMLQEADLAYFEHVKFNRIGVHPDNRFGSGLMPWAVHALLLRIINAGWSWGECCGCIAFEVRRGRDGEDL